MLSGRSQVASRKSNLSKPFVLGLSADEIIDLLQCRAGFAYFLNEFVGVRNHPDRLSGVAVNSIAQ